MSLFSKIAKNAAWTAAGQWIVQLCQFGTTVVLAWLLSPQDYGLVAMSATYIGFVLLFANLGFGPALVQRPNIDHLYINVAFTSTTCTAVILFITSYYLAPAVALFYKEPTLHLIIRVSAFALVLSPFNAILSHLLMRAMRFKELATVNVISSLGAQFVAILAAFLGFGVWSLVAATLFQQVIMLPLLLNRSDYHPHLAFDVARFKDLFSFGGSLMGFNIMNYFSRNLDNIIIGRFLGPVSLGYYDRAYQIMLKPLQNISNTLGQPLFAGLSSTQDNKEETTDTYCKAVFTISLITFPIMLGLSITSSEFMSSVFDPKWAPSIPVLQILSIVGAIQSVGTTVGSIYQSKGRTDIMFGVGILVMICFGCAFLLGVQWGIVGVALSYGIASGSIWVFTHWVANSLLGLSNKRFWKTLATPAMLSISMLIPVAAVKLILKHLNTPAPISLAILITTGGLAYVVLVFRSQHPNILSVKSLVVTKMECINTALCRRLADRLRI